MRPMDKMVVDTTKGMIMKPLAYWYELKQEYETLKAYGMDTEAGVVRERMINILRILPFNEVPFRAYLGLKTRKLRKGSTDHDDSDEYDVPEIDFGN